MQAALSMQAAIVCRAIVAAALLLVGPVSATADVRIKASNGGDVLAYLAFFSLLERSGERVILDGPCFSACTLVLSSIPRERICVTRRAVLGFHAAQLLDRRSSRKYAAPDATQVLAATYPTAVRSWIEQHGGLTSKIIILRGQELTALYPTCA
jgi:hypothetical protein